jgi:GTP cyclohydrolase III
MDHNPRVYFGMDGNQIGRHIETALITGTLDEIEKISQNLSLAIKAVTDRIEANGGKVIFSGGDNIFAEIEFDQDFCEELINTFEKLSGCTASAGIGHTPLETFLALRLAKSKSQTSVNNGNKLILYSEAQV